MSGGGDEGFEWTCYSMHESNREDLKRVIRLKV